MHPRRGRAVFSPNALRRLLIRFSVSALVALVVGLWAAPVTLAATTFPDVPSYHPYFMAIRELATEEIIGGYQNGTFGPEDPITRQQFAKMIVGAGGYAVSESDVCPFTDMDRSDATTFFPDNFVAVCAAHGITTGKTATTFDPYSNISRYQVVSMVVRAAKDLVADTLYEPGDWSGSWGGDPTHGANADLAEMNGLLVGLDVDGVSPYGNMTRGEVAQILHNLFARLNYWYPRSIEFYGFNINHPPLDQVEVRKALALAIDRQAIVESLDLGDTVKLPATGLVPPATPGFDFITQDFLKPTAQIDQARDLLAAAGYPGGAGLPEIVIHTNINDGLIAIANAIKAQWETIGVRSRIVTMSWRDYLDFLSEGSPDLMVYRMGWIADFNDAWEFFNLLRMQGSVNATNWSSAAYNQLLADSLLAASDADRWAAYAAMERILTVDEMPIMPIYWQVGWKTSSSAR